jgi:hypothetical protein
VWALRTQIVEGFAGFFEEETSVGFDLAEAVDNVSRGLVEKGGIAELAFGGGEAFFEFGEFFGKALAFGSDVDLLLVDNLDVKLGR